MYIIRHGETTGDVEDRFGGEYDDHLSAEGIKQAKELGEKLKDKHIEVIYHSPKTRAVETAEILADFVNAPMEKVEDIKERNQYGILSGMVKSEAKQKYPEEIEKLRTTYHDVKGSEDYDFFRGRVLRGFANIINSNYNSALVSHGGPITCFFRERLNKEIELQDCAIVEIDKNLNILNLDKAKINQM